MFTLGCSGLNAKIIHLAQRLKCRQKNRTPNSVSSETAHCNPGARMSRTYSQIVKQIEALKAEAEKLRKGEIDGVVKRIREAIAFYGLKASDLGLGAAAVAASKKTRAKKAGPKKAKDSTPAVVKFRNDSGGTWGGRGKRPQWLRDALATGKTLNDFLVT